jgi:hypothetical protein
VTLTDNHLYYYTCENVFHEQYLNDFFDRYKDVYNKFNSFYENVYDIELNLNPQYLSVEDSSYKHKVYYIDISGLGSNYSAGGHSDIDDITVIQEQQYQMVVATSLDTNVFKYKPYTYQHHQKYNLIGDIVVFRSGRYSIQQSYQFSFDSLIHISDWISRSYKTTTMELFRPTSSHIRNNGGQGSGHDVVVIPVGKRSDIVTKQSFVRQGIESALETTQCGISGRHVVDLWVEIQIVRGMLNNGNLSDFLIEFDYVDWELSRNGSDSRYNFVYELNMESDDTSTRLPDYLKIEDNKKVVGRVLRNEDFLKKYSYEGWVDREKHLSDKHDINTKYLGFEHSRSSAPVYPIETIDSLPVLYPAIDESAKLNTYKVSIKGVNATSSIMQLMDSGGGNSTVLSVGSRISQNDVTGIVVKILGKCIVNMVLNGVFGNYTITKYLIDDIFGGVFNVTNTSTQKIYDLVPIYDENNNLLYYTSQLINSIPNYNNEYVESIDDSNVTGIYQVISSDIDASRGILKFIDLYLPVRRNFTYDRDNFLITSDMLPDTFNIGGEVLDRYEWVTFMRKQGMWGYDDINVVEDISNNIKYIEDDDIYIVKFNDIEYQLSGSSYGLYLQSLIPNKSVNVGISESEDISPFNYGGIEIKEVDFYNVDESIVKISGGGSYARGL